MKTRNDKYVFTINKGKLGKTKLYFNKQWKLYKELDKNNKCIWYWLGVAIDEIIPAYSHYKITK